MKPRAPDKTLDGFSGKSKRKLNCRFDEIIPRLEVGV